MKSQISETSSMAKPINRLEDLKYPT